MEAHAASPDLAIGSRYVPGGEVPGWKLSRRMISQGGNLYAGVVLGMHVRDATAGFRAYEAGALSRIDLEREIALQACALPSRAIEQLLKIVLFGE